MDARLVVEIIIIVVLIAAQGFFALAEFSVIASRKSRLRKAVADKRIGARRAIELHDNSERFLATIQIGMTLVSALVGVVSGATLVERLQTALSQSQISFVAHAASPLAVGITVVSITILAVIIGELVPKYIALSFPERYARLVAPSIRLFYKTTFVFAQVLRGLARSIVRILGVQRDASRDVISEEEIEHIIVEGREKGQFDITEEQFVKKLFEFTDATVRRAMKPRPDVIGIDISSTTEQAMRIIVDNGYSRYPVYDKTIDHIVGVLYTKDLITVRADLTHIDLKTLMRSPVFVPDSMPLPRLLKSFRRGRNHLAVVLDDFGGTAGIITLEDILEELVGEIQDEYDTETARVVRVSDSVVHADGTVWTGAINELLQSHLPEDEEKTLAGLFIDEVGRVPERNESVAVADVRLTVLTKDKNRIVRLKIEKPRPAPAND